MILIVVNSLKEKSNVQKRTSSDKGSFGKSETTVTLWKEDAPFYQQ